MKRLPIKAARDVAKGYGLSQVILAAWDGERTHIVTYGTTVEQCAQAAMGGNKIKDALGWPKDLHAEPSRVLAVEQAAFQRGVKAGLERAAQEMDEAYPNSQYRAEPGRTFGDAIRAIDASSVKEKA